MRRGTKNREISIEMRKAGMSVIEIALELGISRERVCQYLRPLGLSEKEFRRGIVRERMKKHIIDLRSKGKGIRAIVKELHIRHKLVYDIIGPSRPLPPYSKYTGQKFGRLTIIKVYSGGRWRPCLCDCECGTTGFVAGLANVVTGKTKSCGCKRLEYYRRNSS